MNFGITVVNSWMMIDDVMYGMIPRPRTAARASAPPENKLRNPRIPEPFDAFEIFSMFCRLTPGTGMLAPNW